MNKINWSYLSRNPNAIHILEKNMDKINWFEFPLNYDWLKKRMDIIREELMCRVWHPSRIAKWLEQDLDLENL